MTTPQLQILAKCKEVVAKAKELYGIDMSKVQISFNLRGRAAGRASGKAYRDTNIANYMVKFNNDMIEREAIEHINDSTVAHEYAHILSYIDPGRFGKGHDYLWERASEALGGSGARCHTQAVVYSTGTTYEYISTTGKALRLSDKLHSRVQRGETLSYRKDGGQVSKLCAYSIVGVQGRTLAAPIVKQAAAVQAPAAVSWQPGFVPTPEQTAVAKKVLGELMGLPVPAPLVPKATPNPFALPKAPVQRVVVPAAGESKAAISRRIMRTAHDAGRPYEDIIAAMIAANGYSRQLARATYLANYAKAGVPAP